METEQDVTLGISHGFSEVDFREVNNKLIGNIIVDNGKEYQYSLEYRGKCLHIVELNFKPHTKTNMSIPLPVYNDFAIYLKDYFREHPEKMRDGVKANDVMAKFIEICNDYRRKYLGKIDNLKPSSYTRYASIIYLLWKATNGSLGFICSLENKRISKVLELEGEVVKHNSLSKGYFIFIEGEVTLIKDKKQKNLIEYGR